MGNIISCIWSPSNDNVKSDGRYDYVDYEVNDDYNKYEVNEEYEGEANDIEVLVGEDGGDGEHGIDGEVIQDEADRCEDD